MINEVKLPIINTSKRLPVVFCIDVSPAMGEKWGSYTSSIELLNVAISKFVGELKNNIRACVSVEVAFVTFSTNIEMDSDFEFVRSLNAPNLLPVESGNTCISKAILRSIEKIEQRRVQYENAEIGYYAPVLILVTDGDPDIIGDELYYKSLDAIKLHCDSSVDKRKFIAPFIIGVGDNVTSATLSKYSEGFTRDYFRIESKHAKYAFDNMLVMISKCIKKIISMNGTFDQVIASIQTDANDFLD